MVQVDDTWYLRVDTVRLATITWPGHPVNCEICHFHLGQKQHHHQHDAQPPQEFITNTIVLLCNFLCVYNPFRATYRRTTRPFIRVHPNRTKFVVVACRITDSSTGRTQTPEHTVLQSTYSARGVRAIEAISYRPLSIVGTTGGSTFGRPRVQPRTRRTLGNRQ